MPKDLTDVSQWETVAVPVDTDTADAASVETVFQFLADRSRLLRDWISGLRLGNWFDDTDITSITGTDVPWCFCFDSSTGLYTFGTANGYTIISTGGLIWDDEGGGAPTGPNPGAGNNVTDIDSNNKGRRLACADDGTVDDVWYSDTPGTWTRCTIGGSPGLHFDVVGCDKGAAVDIWLIAESATPSAVYRSTYGISFAAVTVTGLTTRVNSIIHTGDPDNDCWILMTDTQCSRSTDGGLTWTTVSHGLGGTNQINSIVYDRDHGRFIVLLDASQDIGYSDDNGANWTKITNALPQVITGSPRKLVANDHGDVLAWCGTLGQIFSTHDGGASWRRRYAPTSMSTQYCMPGSSTDSFVWAKYSAGWVIQRSLG